MRKRISIILFCVILVTIALFLIENETKFLRHTVDNVLYDNYRHYLTCDKLPVLSIVTEKVAEKEATINQIISIDKNSVSFEVDSTSCPGKGSIVISYPSHAIRMQIEEILDGTTFFGIPLTLINQ